MSCRPLCYAAGVCLSVHVDGLEVRRTPTTRGKSPQAKPAGIFYRCTFFGSGRSGRCHVDLLEPRASRRNPKYFQGGQMLNTRNSPRRVVSASIVIAAVLGAAPARAAHVFPLRLEDK